MSLSPKASQITGKGTLSVAAVVASAIMKQVRQIAADSSNQTSKVQRGVCVCSLGVAISVEKVCRNINGSHELIEYRWIYNPLSKSDFCTVHSTQLLPDLGESKMSTKGWNTDWNNWVPLISQLQCVVEVTKGLNTLGTGQGQQSGRGQTHIGEGEQCRRVNEVSATRGTGQCDQWR